MANWINTNFISSGEKLSGDTKANIFYVSHAKQKELTQEELAEKLGISVRYVQLLEGKNTPNVKLDTVEALSKALRIQPADLLKY